MIVRQRLAAALMIEPEQPIQHGMFPLGPEYGAALPFLERSDPAAYFRTTPQQGQKFVVDLVNGRPQFRQFHDHFSLMSSSIRIPK